MNRLLLAALLATCAPAAMASSFQINSLQLLNQQEFHELAQDLGAALSYKPLEPAETLGIGGFDIGAALTGTSLANTAAVQKAVNGSVFNTLPVPTLRATLGLPYNMDFGAMYSRVPSSGINLFGADLKWAVLPGDVALPAVALRASVTRLDGVSQMGFESVGGDVSISKGFVFVTPYAGLGEVWSRSSPNGLTIQQENLTQAKVFAGVDLHFALMNFVVEADSTGGIRSYGGKFGLRF